jgi:hypothetical protein
MTDPAWLALAVAVLAGMTNGYFNWRNYKLAAGPKYDFEIRHDQVRLGPAVFTLKNIGRKTVAITRLKAIDVGDGDIEGDGSMEPVLGEELVWLKRGASKDITMGVRPDKRLTRHEAQLLRNGVDVRPPEKKMKLVYPPRVAVWIKGHKEPIIVDVVG